MEFKLSIYDFLNTLFDADELTCFSKTCTNTNISDIPKDHDLFFCINPLKGNRSDSNVLQYRNFLIEIDSLPLEQQINYVKAKGVPITSIVYSGGKSYHFIISLEAPAKTEGEYQEIADRLLALFPEADSSCRNPSRFSRLPFRFRNESKKWQTLIECNGRVNKDEFLSLLPPLPPSWLVPARISEPSKQFLSVSINYAVEQPDLFIQDRGFAGRNHFFFYLYNRMKDEGMPIQDIKFYIEKTYQNLKNKTDFTLKEAYSAARIY